MANLNERLEVFLEKVDKDHKDYYLDREMGHDTVTRNLTLLSKVKKGMKWMSKNLKKKEMVELLDAAEAIYPLEFYSGTGYGTGYGSRQLSDIIKNTKKQLEVLDTEELRVNYIATLHQLYKIRSHMYVIPVTHVLKNRLSGEFPHGTIDYMNNKFKSAETPDKKLKIMEDIITEAEEHYR